VLRACAERLGLEIPDERVFEDQGHCGATLVRPALERLRDLVAGVGIDVVLCYSPDRLARKFAYQALLIEEFTRAGTRVEFVKGPRGDSPEDQLLVQFQGMFAEYEKAQIMKRYRRGKAHRAKTGSINVLGGAPFGYRYIRKTAAVGAAYEIVEHEAALVAELFRRYAEDGASIAELTRWLTDQQVPTRTGKHRWDRSVVWGMLRNPAYAGRAVFGKTMVVHESPALNRIARLRGRFIPRAHKTVDRPREEWTEIPVPAIVDEDTFDRRQAAGRQQTVRIPQRQGAVAAARAGRLRKLRIRLLPHLHPHHQQEDLLLPVPGLRRLPPRGRAGLRQQAGARRSSRHRSVGSRHWAAGRPATDPHRDRQAPRLCAHRQPCCAATETTGYRIGQDQQRHRRHDRGVRRTTDHHR